MPPPNKLTREQKAKIVRLYNEENLAPQFLAERFNVSRNTIYHVVNTHKKKELPHGVCNVDKGPV